VRTAGVRYNRDVNYESSREPGGYEQFFGFDQPPFSLAPDTRFRFDSASHAAALKEITYALERREPIVVVTGEIGTGKTLLCRTVIERSDRKTFVAIINDPQLQRDDLLTRMLEDFGVVSKDRAARAPIARHELVHALQEFLGSLAPIQAHAVVILDEAQHAQPDVLEQIRLVSNIQDERGTLLQIMLVGQPGLNDLLAQPELRQLTQRVSRFARLDPLTAPEVARYIGHRLAVARERTKGSALPGASELERELAAWDGSQPDAPFAPDAIAAVAQISGGIPRVVNLLCDRALEAAYRGGLRTVDASTINGAAGALGLAAAAKPAAAALPVWPQLAAADSAATPAPEPPAASSARRYGAIAATVAVVAIAWFGVRSAARRSPGEPVSRPAPAAAPQPARPAQAASTPAAAPRDPATPTPATEPTPAPSAPAPPVTTTPPATPPRTTGTGAAAPAPAGGAFEIVVASFRTEARAADVVTAITALGEPVQRRFIGGWQQVVAGPYASDDLVRAAQQRLARAGFSGTHITATSR
jgi:general secretion pathway protein A